jgi:redox-sensing transcriptional repressor
MQSSKKISLAVIRRLPRYYRYLDDLLKKDINKTSSGDLSELMGITASQIRQDLSNFGSFGQQGYGYNVENLLSEIKKILNVDKIYKLVIVGIGNIGNAITSYIMEQYVGIELVALFDNNENVIGTTVYGLKVKNVNLLSEFIRQNNIEIAALTIPEKYANDIAKIAVDAGVEGIWNFCPTDLEVPSEIMVENVNLSDGLMILSFRINNQKTSNN